MKRVSVPTNPRKQQKVREARAVFKPHDPSNRFPCRRACSKKLISPGPCASPEDGSTSSLPPRGDPQRARCRSCDHQPASRVSRDKATDLPCDIPRDLQHVERKKPRETLCLCGLSLVDAFLSPPVAFWHDLLIPMDSHRHSRTDREPKSVHSPVSSSLHFLSPRPNAATRPAAPSNLNGSSVTPLVEG
jgi:hypothetical protein